MMNYFTPVTTSDVINIANKLKLKHSSDFDGLFEFFVKKTIKAVVFPLAHIINTSF